MSEIFSEQVVSRVRESVDRDRLLETATLLVGIPSPTGSATAVAESGQTLLIIRVIH